MQYTSITPNSPQWKYSQFRLQLILSHPNIEIISIQKNSVNCQSFFVNKENHFKIDAALDVTEESQGDVFSLKKNTRKGCIFKCGRVQQEARMLDGMGQKKLYRMLLMKIAVGDMLPIYQSQSIARDDLMKYTSEYDSIYLSSRQEETSIYSHQYYLRSPSQYLWEYDIVYSYIDPSETQSRVRLFNPEHFKCEECLTNNAQFHCIEQKQLFCQECFEDVHRGKYRNPHKREYLSPFNCHKKCERAGHGNLGLRFFCFGCEALKCEKCLADSIHSLQKQNQNKGNKYNSSIQRKNIGLSRQRSQQGRKSLSNFKHEFYQVHELIQDLKNTQNHLHTQLKHKLITSIRQVEQLIAQIKYSYELKLTELQKNLTKQLIQLKRQSRRQVNKAVAIHVQLKRKFDEVLWMQKFLECNEEILDAESNILLKRTFGEFVGFMNAEDYFMKIENKVKDLKLSKSE